MYKELNQDKEWFLGLDVGTNSIGWAATDREYNLLRFHGNATWGIYLFDEAKTAEERRVNRVARRRLQRKKQRVEMLQDFFAKEIAKYDEHFFIRIKESGLWTDDRTTSNELFVGDWTDKKYNETYPTIHHLICDLMDNKSFHDPRLVYMACSYILSHRGHFLLEVDSANVDSVTDFKNIYGDLLSWFDSASLEYPWFCEAEAFAEVMKSKVSPTAKEKKFYELLFKGKKPEDKYNNLSIKSLIALICNRKIKISDLFFNDLYSELENNSLSISAPDFDDVLGLLSSNITDDEFDLLFKVKRVYDWSVLVDILGSEKYISAAKVKVYEQHKKDLAFLKKLVKKYLSKNDYEKIFNTIGKEPNYASYSYNVKKLAGKPVPNDYKMCSSEDFCSYIKKHMASLESLIDKDDREQYEDMMLRLNLNSFCPKQMTGDNRVIPYQLYLVELKKILDNASEYLSFLNESDSYGTVKEKIVSIMTFKIPYYVGPLNTHSNFAWVVKKSDAKIYPWNFDEIVDKDSCEENFIRRMTCKCSYLAGEDVLPKNSLLYSKFTVLNEINNIRINGCKITPEIKQGIYENLFLKKRKVTIKDIKNYLRSNVSVEANDAFEIAGIDTTIKSSLTSYHDFKSFLDKGVFTEFDVERIINRITLTTDKKRLFKWLITEYDLSENDAKAIVRFKYSDFGRLSARLLTEVFDLDIKTGEIRSNYNIIQRMWNTNDNLMMLLSDDYGYKDNIKTINDDYYSSHDVSLDDQLKNMYISNSVKRPILKTLDIVKELVKIEGCPPKKIFVEMARGASDDQRNKRTKSRKEQIKEFYSGFDNSEVASLLEELEMKTDDQLRNNKLFLYFTQLGRCMYSGEPIDINDIGNSKLYDIDHIWPQSKIKDDSIDNTVLVKTTYNGKKGDSYPVPEEWRNARFGLWSSLHDKKLISDKKFDRLRRTTRFTDEELASFINRQLVETRQSTKAIAQILQDMYKETIVVYVKAGLVSDFRNTYKDAPYFALKCREVNDYHHARDAYLNIVMGNIYNVQFTRNPLNFIKDGNRYTLNLVPMLEHDVERMGEVAWRSKDDVWFNRVISTIHNNNVRFVRYSACQKGALFDLMPLRKCQGQVPRKKKLSDIDRYGGYNKAANTGFYLVKHDDKKGRAVSFVAVPLKDAVSIKGETDIISFCEKEGYANPKILLNGRMIKYNSLMEIDGYRVLLSGKASGSIWFKGAMQLIVSPEEEKYIKNIVKYFERNKGNKSLPEITTYDGITGEENISLYDVLKDKLNNSKYRTLMETAAKTLVDGRELFVNLKLSEQVIALYHILELFGCNDSHGKDLTLIGGSKSSGIQTMGMKLSSKRFKTICIIDQSPTGLFEVKSPNLLEL